MGRYNAHIQIGDVEEVPVTVHYTLYEFCAGKTDGKTGPKLEPDEPAHIEIDQIVIDKDGSDYTPTKELETALKEEIGDWLHGRYDQEPPERESDR